MGLLGGEGIVGLELDSGVIRGVEMRGRYGSAVVARTGQVPIPDAAMAEGMIVDLAAVKSGINHLWRTSKFRTRNVVLGVSNQGVLMRLARFPRIPERKLDSAIRFQASDYFPIPLSQLVLDFKVVGAVHGEHGDEMDVLLVAGRRDMIEKNVMAATSAGLRLKAIDTCSLSLMWTAPQDKLGGNVALVNIANGLTNVLVVSERVPRLGRLMQSSLSDYAKEVETDVAGMVGSQPNQRHSSESGSAFSVEELKTKARRRRAERKQKVEGLAPARALEDWSLSEWVISLAAEVQSTITYFSSHSRGDSVKEIIVSGTGARVPGLVETLGRELGLSASTLDMGNRVRWPGKQKNEREALEYAVCIGLALRGLGE